MNNDFELETELRRGLRAVPVPAVSAGFDAAVLAGLQQPRPWWANLWSAMAPAALSCGVSLLLTAAIVVKVANAPLDAAQRAAVPAMIVGPDLNPNSVAGDVAYWRLSYAPPLLVRPPAPEPARPSQPHRSGERDAGPRYV